MRSDTHKIHFQRSSILPEGLQLGLPHLTSGIWKRTCPIYLSQTKYWQIQDTAWDLATQDIRHAEQRKHSQKAETKYSSGTCNEFCLSVDFNYNNGDTPAPGQRCWSPSHKEEKTFCVLERMATWVGVGQQSCWCGRKCRVSPASQ